MRYQNYSKNAFLYFFLMLFVFSSISLFAQEKDKGDLKKKLSELKGKVEKITVKVDGKDVVFEGKDAENLVKKMRTSESGVYSYSVSGSGIGRGTGKGKGHAYTIITDNKDELKDDDAKEENVFVTIYDDEKDAKKVKVEKKEGKTTVTITTTDKDGKEVEKVLEGDDAEKYLKDNEDGVTILTSGVKMMHSKIPMKVKFIKAKPAKTIIIEKDEDEDDDDTAVIVEKAEKVKKDVIIKKKKAEISKEEKEK